MTQRTKTGLIGRSRVVSGAVLAHLIRCVVLALACLSTGVSVARAEQIAPLEPGERALLRAGQRIERPLEFATRLGRSVGGLSYQVVRGQPAEVLAVLLDVRHFPHMLPRTRSARLVSKTATEARVELEQGVAPFIARYTLVVRPVAGRDELQFWLDPTLPHDIGDVRGFFRVERFGPNQSLLTAAATVDLGDGLFSGLFESRVQALLLRSVTNIRDFLEPPHVAQLSPR